MMYYIWKIVRFLFLKPLFLLLGRFNRAGMCGTDMEQEEPNCELRYRRINDGKVIPVMTTNYDCENIAILTALYGSGNNLDFFQLCKKYTEISNALLRCECLEWFQNPIYGNPWNVRCALEQLGCHVENVHPDDIKDNDDAIILIHWRTGGVGHVLMQHWISHIYGNKWNFGDGAVHTVDREQMVRYWKCRLYSTCYRIKKINVDTKVKIL